jgi:hypothetical protein
VLEDATVRATLQHGGSQGDGLEASSWTDLIIRRSSFIDNFASGIRMYNSSSTSMLATLEDIEVRDTKPSGPGEEDGRGIYAGTSIDPDEDFPLDLEVHRARLVNNTSSALLLFFVRAELEDITGDDTQFGLEHNSLGHGLNVSESEVHGVRLSFDHNFDAGVVVFGARGKAALEDLVVRNTTCNDAVPFCGANRGAGVAIQEDGYASIDRFLFDANVLNGLQLNFQATGDLSNGLISNHPTGIFVRAGGFDVQRAGVNVQFEHNRANIASGDNPM